jgi:hypothetical protein
MSDHGPTKEKINTIYIKIRDWVDETYSHLDRLTMQRIRCILNSNANGVHTLSQDSANVVSNKMEYSFHVKPCYRWHTETAELLRPEKNYCCDRRLMMTYQLHGYMDG